MAAFSGPGMLAHQHQQYQREQLQQSQPQPSDKTLSSSSPPSQDPSTSSFSSSPRQFDLTESILEEGGESGSESLVEPVTPVSGRYSQDFSVQSPTQDLSDSYQYKAVGLPINPAPTSNPKDASALGISQSLPTQVPASFSPSAAASRNPLNINTLTQTSTNVDYSSSPRAADSDAASTGAPLTRRSTRGSTSSFKRTMSSFFRRSTSQIQKDQGSAIMDSGVSVASESTNTTSNAPSRASTTRRWSMNRSSNTTRSNSPPSPGLEMAPSHRERPAVNGTPSQNGQIDNKKNRTGTGFTLRGRAVNFVGATVGRGGARPERSGRRASSFDGGSRPSTPQPTRVEENDASTYPPERLPWALPPAEGTGAKARRMSLSLPDDFAVDVAELQSEFEYQHKFLGRHGKHLGKGAASKVTLMARKGSPEELYAVKEFRGKSHRESQEEYEKKIKSEFSIAKSLHHPNIVETIRLCTDHSRWNHVMEYCSEGDLFSLVQKGHLKGEDRKKDRLCLFKQLIQGVSYLHANGIAHRDIKLENLLITKDSKLKITDFGVSEVFSGIHPGVREAGGQCGRNMGEVRLCSPGICGSEPYIAPEVLTKKEAYDPRALDVWSSAIIMIYLTFGGAIWSRAEAGNPHYDKLVQGWERWYTKHPDPDACITETDYPKCYALDVGVTPPALRRLLLQMLNPDPHKRIGIDEVINNRWMKNVECCQVESYEDPTLVIDATKLDATKNGNKKIACHNHLPPKGLGTHSLGKMPGQPGY